MSFGQTTGSPAAEPPEPVAEPPEPGLPPLLTLPPTLADPPLAAPPTTFVAPACALPPDEPPLGDVPLPPVTDPPFEVGAEPPTPLPLFWLPVDALPQLTTSAATDRTAAAEDSTEKRKRRVMGLGSGLSGDRAVLAVSARSYGLL